MTLISTAVFMEETGLRRYFEPRREHNMNITQARKAASRFWGRRVREAGHQLERICLVECSGVSVRTHEKVDDRWLCFAPPEDAPGYLNACLTLAGWRASQVFLPPPTLEINGYVYRLDV
ncbi:MAG: hypothetical protein ABJN26_25170 [Stappiaceae bacterium]